MARSNTEASVAAREMARNRVLAIDERFGDLQAFVFPAPPSSSTSHSRGEERIVPLPR